MLKNLDADVDEPTVKTRLRFLIGALTVAAIGLVAVPAAVGTVPYYGYYLAVAAASLATAVLGVRVNRPSRSRAWILVLLGLACRFIGDVLWAASVSVWHLDPFPSVADVAYLTSMPLMVLGLSVMVRSREPRGDRGATLDTAIMVAGTTVLAGVFVIAPHFSDTSRDLVSRVIGTAYPVGDVVLVALLARLWTSSGVVVRSYRLLGAGLLFLFAGDMGYDLVFQVTGYPPDGVWFDLSYLLAYACIAAAMLHSSMGQLTEPAAVTVARSMGPRLIALAVASTLAPSALLIQGLRGQPLLWQLIAPGSIVLAVLVMCRLGGLLQTIQRQAVQLAALARTDGLTGVPNRRSWDMELSRALADARTSGRRLCVALLDLDHFKHFNDTHGHPAGDELLKQATAAWGSALPGGAVLARYGGEEFAVLLRGHSVPEAYRVLEMLRAATPLQQSFSAGLVDWDGSEGPGALIARADTRLYEAKRAGRGRIHSAPGSTERSVTDSPMRQRGRGQPGERSDHRTGVMAALSHRARGATRAASTNDAVPGR